MTNIGEIDWVLGTTPKFGLKEKRTQRIEEHKGSAIGNHLREQHDMEPEDIAQSFRILRKCQNKFDCLIFEMFFIQELKPTLNKQCDSIRAKLFV